MAVCDRELAGKVLAEGRICINASEKFYGSNEISAGELRTLLKEFDNINLLGNKAVKVAVEEKLINEDEAIVVQGVKHAQVFKL